MSPYHQLWQALATAQTAGSPDDFRTSGCRHADFTFYRTPYQNGVFLLGQVSRMGAVWCSSLTSMEVLLCFLLFLSLLCFRLCLVWFGIDYLIGFGTCAQRGLP